MIHFPQTLIVVQVDDDVLLFDVSELMCLLFVPMPCQPFLLPSESRVEYDSEESLGSEDEEDEEDYSDAFDSGSPLKEHSNHNSYRCPRPFIVP